MASPLYIAVDLGAGSGRVYLAGVDPGELFLEELHRFQYPPRNKSGHLRWNFSHIFDEIKQGLKNGGIRAAELGRSIRSIGVDSWGVDYGLLDRGGKLIADPICYRDKRTDGAMERVFAIVPRAEIFEKTGIQFQNFNSLYQLFSEGENIEAAARMLLLPDLINFFLTGEAMAEYTNATTTQMISAATGEWDLDLIERLNLPAYILPRIVPAGTDLGPLKPELEAELDLYGVRLIAPATHDTGSAVAGTPIAENSAYISSGTWSLIGVEKAEPLINDAAAAQNFTNEGGAFGTYRFLKNVMGLWIFESCRREWEARGLDVEYELLLAQVVAAKDFDSFIFPDDQRFLNPPSMLEAVETQLRKTEQPFDPDPTSVSKIIFDSLAFRYASVLRSIGSLTGRKIENVQIVGGGGRNGYLNQMTANASGLKVLAGLTEATVVGNVLVQAISAGRFASLAEARLHVLENVEFEEFVPQRSPALDQAADRYAEIEARFVN